MDLKLLIPLSEVPDGEIVTKRTGNKPYTVRRKITLYSKQEGVRNHEFSVQDGCAILLDAETGNGAIYPESTIVVWNTTLRDVTDLVESKYAK